MTAKLDPREDGANGAGHGHRPAEAAGFNFSTFFIKNPVTTIILMLILVILGLASAAKMPLELFPNIEFPVVVISTVYPGAAPAEVETLVTKPIEDSLSGLNGLDTLTSQSKDGLSLVICQMKLEVSAKDAATDIRDKVSGVLYKLPKEVRPPSYSTFSGTSMPIVTYAISGHMSPEALSTYFKDQLQPKLESVEGTAQIQLLGNAERTVEVDLDPGRLQAYGLALPTVFQAIQAQNYNLPGGKIDASPRSYSLRVMGKAATPEALGDLRIPAANGAWVRLADLGSVRDTIKDPATYAAIDGDDALLFSVLKQTDANAVHVGEAMDKELAQLAPTLPEGLHITKASDTTHFVKQSNDAVWEHLTMGAVLAVLVLYLFLRSVSAMVISGLAIPLSIICAFTPMVLFGFSFNNLTMLALSLVVGILVDDAVVDLENIYRHMENGEPPIRAAINATGEIQLAVTATTLTIVGVFLPMSFMSGYIGKFFRSFGLTVTFAVVFSLLIARTLTPTLAAYLLKVKKREAHEVHAEGDLSGRYPRFLGWALRHRAIVVAVAFLTFVFGMGLSAFIQKGFMSNADRGEFLLRVQLPKGTTIDRTAQVANDVARRVRPWKGVDHVYTMIGEDGNPDNARLDVLLVDKGKRSKSDAQIAKEVREAFATYPDAKVMADELSMVGGNNKPVDVELQGDNLDQLKVYSDQLATLMHRKPYLVDIETSLGMERAEVRVLPDRARMAQEGVTTMQLAQTLSLATTGDTPNTMSLGPDEVDVWVRLAPAFRKDVAALSALTLQTAHGPVPLSAIATVEPGGGFPQIDRQNRQRLVHVTANLTPGTSVGTATDAIVKEFLPQLHLPPNMTVDWEGQAKQQKDAFTGFGQAMLMGVVLIYFILALQFGSFLHPLTIMFSLPLSIAGAMMGLLAFNKELGMMSLIGIIMLMGIVTKNAILIVDFIITMRNRGYARDEAVLRGAQVRMRPILMTTAAMVLGMLPMALGIGAGAEFRAPMAVVVIGGLLTSTALTLVVVPVAYTLMEDTKRFWWLFLGKRDPEAARDYWLVHMWAVPVTVFRAPMPWAPAVAGFKARARGRLVAKGYEEDTASAVVPTAVAVPTP